MKCICSQHAKEPGCLLTSDSCWEKLICRWGPVELKRWRQSQERSANTAAVCGCVLHPMWCKNSLAQSHADSMPEAVTLSSPCTQHLGGAAWSCLQRQSFGTV